MFQPTPLAPSARLNTAFGASMILPLVVAFFVTLPSVLLIRMIERWAVFFRRGENLPRWRRLLIPLPIVLCLVSNLDGILSLLAYLDTHPAIPARYAQNQAWNADRFAHAGFIAAAFLPFFLVNPVKSPLDSLGFAIRVWAGHACWLLFPFAPLLLASGVPLRQ